MGVNDYVQIGSRIKEARKKANIQQKEMAKILNIPISTYSGYENNHREPNTEMLGRIADTLNVSVDWLIYGKKGFTFREHKEKLTPEEAIAMLQKVATQTKDTQEKIMVPPGVLIEEMAQQLLALSESTEATMKEILLSHYEQLNRTGKTKVISYVEDISQIEKYQRDPDTKK